MTDKEKIAILEKENRALREENEKLISKQKEMARLTERMNAAADAINKARQEVDNTTQALRLLKSRYVKACDEAMKATVKPYAKALRVVKRKGRNANKK